MEDETMDTLEEELEEIHGDWIEQERQREEERERSRDKEKEEENFKSFYRDLLLRDDDHLENFMHYGRFPDLGVELSIEMFNVRYGDGVSALKAYIARLLRKKKGSKYERLLELIADVSGEPGKDVGTLLSDVQPQKMPWLWYPRLALGKIATLDGDPGLGKSLIGADIGARITKGEKMPDGMPCLATGGVVVIMPEDTLQDTIQPRFARAGADLSKVVDLSTVEADEGEESRRLFRLQDDLYYLEEAIRRVNAKLVYIDPVMALAGGANMNQDDDVRKLLSPLKMLVEELQVACILVRHMTKTRGESPLMAGQGSIAFIGLARTGLMVVKSPEDKSQMVLSHIKSNVGPLAPGITYSICSDEVAGDDRPYIVWGNEIELSAGSYPRKTSRK